MYCEHPWFQSNWILKSSEKYWCHDLSKGPYLLANTTVVPDRITNKIVNILGVQDPVEMASKGFRQKAISNSRIPFSTTARCDNLFWDKVMWCGNVIFWKERYGVTRMTNWESNSQRNCLRLQHHRQREKLFLLCVHLLTVQRTYPALWAPFQAFR